MVSDVSVGICCYLFFEKSKYLYQKQTTEQAMMRCNAPAQTSNDNV